MDIVPTDVTLVEFRYNINSVVYGLLQSILQSEYSISYFILGIHDWFCEILQHANSFNSKIYLYHYTILDKLLTIRYFANSSICRIIASICFLC
jgi:hypothetical protein